MIPRVAMWLLFMCAAAEARGLRQQIPTGTVPGTSVKGVDLTRRTGAGQVLNNQVQSGARQGSTANPVATLDRTRAASRANPALRTAVGSNAAQSAVRTAVRTNNAAGGTAAGGGIGRVTANGLGTPVSSTGARASTAQMATSAAVQQAARGGSAANAAATGQSTARGSQIRTSFATPAGAGRR
ncbi:hypothetical protein Rsub_00231 [Raphidocelis subcapitata]|uniref:Uncharacterized protein n=1 Tax=Raphidocelis subcapitata TaxID=307507 RepID=A0A2V0NPU2_9CHLO|nr:hypothetical protein Rsub_00231 [Raphidocelis subcapitata]|eukprot:GBF87520.1 hypothetical protein Rsub_00231 [Raphidocelis subcapitata]